MNHKQLVQQMSDMKAELDKYQAELTQLRSQVATYEDVEEAPAPVSTTSRRKLLRRMAIAGIGGIGALGLAASVGSTNTVLAETTADNAIEAVGGNAGYGLRASGGLAPLFLVGAGSAGAPASGAHQVGELYVDSAGTLYYCVTAGTPGTWRQVSGSNTSGSLHLFSSPSRFVDTRSSGPINDNGGAYTHNSPRTYQLTALTGSGSVTIPTGATGVIGNITIVGPGAPGFGAVYTGTFNNTSNINFVAGVTIANSFSSSLDATGHLSVLVRFPSNTSATADILLDIAGYYL